ncbi:MAG: type VI secretion system-associated FHA domain protein [bacterium]
MEAKSKDLFLENLAEELRGIYRINPANAENLITSFLAEKLQAYPLAEKINILKKLAQLFNQSAEGFFYPSIPQELADLFSALFGKRYSLQDLSSPDALEKLTVSLNTVFDTLNQIIGVIQSTLLGRKTELETIRLVIGSNIAGESPGGDSLQNYLKQIKDAFLVSHKAFQQAAQTKMGEILQELDPERIAAEGEGGFEFGPLRKAKLFDLYKEKYIKAKGYYESGRFLEELLREFEKSCQKLYAMVDRGGI